MRSHLIKILKNNQIKHFPCATKKIPQQLLSRYIREYNSHNRKKILNGDPLNDNHILYFNNIVKNCSYYNPQETALLDVLHRIEEISPNQKQIQILFQKPPPGGEIGRWVCSYYDTKT